MIFQHNLVIHLVNVVAGQDQNIFRIILLHILHVLVNGIGRSGVPVAAFTLLVWREHCDSAYVSVKVPRNPDPDVGIQS